MAASSKRTKTGQGFAPQTRHDLDEDLPSDQLFLGLDVAIAIVQMSRYVAEAHGYIANASPLMRELAARHNTMPRMPVPDDLDPRDVGTVLDIATVELMKLRKLVADAKKAGKLE